MLILVDTEKLIVVHRYPNRATLSFLAHIELAHSSCIILEERGSFDHFSLQDLYVLYKNSNTKQEWKYGTHAIISEAFSDICESMPISDVNSFEVTTQAMSISMKDKGYYRYQNKRSTPLNCSQLPVLKALTGNGKATGTPPPGPTALGTPVAVKAPAVPLQGAAPKYAPPWG